MMHRTVIETLVADHRSAMERAAAVHRLHARGAVAVVRTSAAAAPVTPAPTCGPAATGSGPCLPRRRRAVVWG